MPICLYWRSVGYSPGEPCAYVDHLALELHGQIHQMGWNMVSQLRTLELTRDQADSVLTRLQWLTNYVEHLRRQQTAQE